MAKTFDPKDFEALANGMGQLATLAHSAQTFGMAMEAARRVMQSVAEAEELRDKAKEELAMITAQITQAKAEVTRAQLDLSDLAKKKQAALRAALDAFEDIK